MEAVNERFKLIRKELKKKQSEMAAELGVSRSHISNIEAGRERISLTVIKLLSALYDINEEWLLTGDGDIFNNYFDWDEVNNQRMEHKYILMEKSLKDYMSKISKEQRLKVINDYGHFVSLETMGTGRFADDELDEYINNLHNFFDELEKFVFGIRTDKLLFNSRTKIEFIEMTDLLEEKDKIQNLFNNFTSGVIKLFISTTKKLD